MRYVKKAPDAPSVDRSFGTAMHLAVNAWHSDRTMTETLPEHFAAQWEITEQQLTLDGITPADLYLSQGVALATLAARIFPRGRGVPERRLFVRTDGIDVPLLGYLDLADEDAHEVWELKTARQPWAEGRAAEEYQGHFYSALWRCEFGRFPERQTYVILSRQPKPAVQVVELVPDPERAAAALVTARDTLAGILAGNWEARCTPGRCRWPERCRP
jgi:uncharacterized cupin superfamily protein